LKKIIALLFLLSSMIFAQPIMAKADGPTGAAAYGYDLVAPGNGHDMFDFKTVGWWLGFGYRLKDVLGVRLDWGHYPTYYNAEVDVAEDEHYGNDEENFHDNNVIYWFNLARANIPQSQWGAVSYRYYVKQWILDPFNVSQYYGKTYISPYYHDSID
jgi:hypothetical protein